MFPQCFPVLPHWKHCFQRQFCFQEAKSASATRQKHFVFPRGVEAWQNEETIGEACFWKHVSSFCQALTQNIVTLRIIYYLLTESEVITGKSQTEALMY